MWYDQKFFFSYISSFTYLFVIWLCWGNELWVAACKPLVAACGSYFPDQGMNLSPLHWEHGVLATGPPGKCPLIFF